jgi:hypothetical protein
MRSGEDELLLFTDLIRVADATPVWRWQHLKQVLHAHGHDNPDDIFALIRDGARQRLQRRPVLVVGNAPDTASGASRASPGGSLGGPQDDWAEIDLLLAPPDPTWFAALEAQLAQEAWTAGLRLAVDLPYADPVRTGGHAFAGTDPFVPPPAIDWQPVWHRIEAVLSGTEQPPRTDDGQPSEFMATVADHGGTTLVIRRCRCDQPLRNPELAGRWTASIDGCLLSDPRTGEPARFIGDKLARLNVGAVVRCPSYALHFAWRPRV